MSDNNGRFTCDFCYEREAACFGEEGSLEEYRSLDICGTCMDRNNLSSCGRCGAIRNAMEIRGENYDEDNTYCVRCMSDEGVNLSAEFETPITEEEAKSAVPLCSPDDVARFFGLMA